jgi:hypothetical protein
MTRSFDFCATTDNRQRTQTDCLTPVAHARTQGKYYHLLDICLYVTDPTSMEQHLYFINNLAGIAGDDIYGASLEWCAMEVAISYTYTRRIIQVCLLSLVTPCVFADVTINVHHCAITYPATIVLFPTIQVRLLL